MAPSSSPTSELGLLSDHRVHGDDANVKAADALSLKALELPPWGATAERVADALQEEILAGRLPPGTCLHEARIARQLGVSRTPVREALRQLASHELIHIEPNHGASVLPVRAADVVSLYLVRERLDGLAARFAAEKVTPEAITKLGKVHEAAVKRARSEDVNALLRRDVEFHACIRETADDRYLDRFLCILEANLLRSGPTSYRAPGRIAQALKEHARILKAIGSGDPEVAEREAVSHVRHARAAREKVLRSDVRKK